MRDKIVNSFDIWIAAQGLRSRLRIKNVDNISLEGIGRLRELILELAVQGKLVPQDPSDKPALLLLETISSEKKRLIDEGKIKKQNPLAGIDEEEQPFVLPNGWVWTRLGDLSSDVHYGFTASANEQIQDVRLLRITDIQDGLVNWETVPGCEIDDKQVENYLLENGDILIARTGGTIGKSYLVANISIKSVFASYLIRVRRLHSMYPDFIKTFLGSQLYWRQLHENSMGTGQPNVNGNALKNLIFPLAPLSEQYRIVAKVDELMSLCDELEQQETNHLKSHHLLVETLLATLTNAADANESQTAWNRLAKHFDDLFTTEDSIDQLKQTILQLAVMGKLVPQDPKDEPASVLLEKIAQEKERLIEEGKIKKQKPLPEIAKEEMPFELPKGWQWERLSNFCELVTKGSSPKWQGIVYTENKSDVLFVTSENVGSYKLLLDSKKYVERKFNEIEPRSILKKGDYLMNIVGGSIGRTAIYDIDDLANINQAVCLIRALTQFFNDIFLLHFFNSEICVSYMFDKQVDNARANLSMGNISKFVIPIPPLAEQHRIVAKINELFALCDRLKEGIGESQKVVNLMANSIVEQVV